jgi:class 3 adenylate cyclase
VFVTGGASNCELFWELPGWAHYLRRLGSFSRMVWFDKRGTGLSDRDVSTTAVEARMLDIGVVMDAVGMERAVLVGMSEGSLMSALFAATFPERVDGLVLMCGMAHGGAVPLLEALAASASELWGTGTALAMMWAHGIADDQLLGRIERSMGTPTAMARLARITMDFDVRPVLPLVQAPTVVAHCADDPIIPVAAGRELAAGIPGATFVELVGDFHGSGRPAEMERYAAVVEQSVVGAVGTARRTERVLATVLFTDIIDSTARATAEGDRRWADLLDDHDRICTRAVAERGGRVVKMTGDGLLATFDGPAAAIGAATAMGTHLVVLGLAIRAGVHTGEVERREDDIGGVGVNLAARVMGEAGAGEVWVSSTVPGLSAGSGITFISQGPHALKGIDGEQELHLAVLAG